MSEKPKKLKVVGIQRQRERSVEEMLKLVAGEVEANEVRAIAIVTVRKDGRVMSYISKNGDVFAIIGAMEGMKFDLLNAGGG